MNGILVQLTVSLCVQSVALKFSQSKLVCRTTLRLAHCRCCSSCAHLGYSRSYHVQPPTMNSK